MKVAESKVIASQANKVGQFGTNAITNAKSHAGKLADSMKTATGKIGISGALRGKNIGPLRGTILPVLQTQKTVKLSPSLSAKLPKVKSKDAERELRNAAKTALPIIAGVVATLIGGGADNAMPPAEPDYGMG